MDAGRVRLKNESTQSLKRVRDSPDQPPIREQNESPRSTHSRQTTRTHTTKKNQITYLKTIW